MFSLLRLRLSLLLLGPDVLTPTYRTLLRGFLFFFFHPGSHLCRQFAELLLLLRRIQISPTLPRRWPRIPSDASKRSSEKTQDCCRIPLTLRFKCLGVSGSFLNGYATPTDILSWAISRRSMSLDIINARPFRKQVERFHELVILRLMVIFLCSTWQRVVSTVRPNPFFFDTIMQMIAYLIRFWLLLS